MPDTTQKSKKKRGVLFALLLTLVAVGIVAAAVVWAGGVEGVTELLGLDGGGTDIAVTPDDTKEPVDDSGSQDTTPAVSIETTPSAEETATVSDDDGDDSADTDGGGDVAVAGVFPTGSAQAAMYREQLQSQSSLTDLADNKWASFALGAPTVSATKAVIPISARYRSGAALGGSLTVLSSDGIWYFSSFAGIGDSATLTPRNLGGGVVATIASQQATASNQELIRTGLVEHGFTTCRVDGVARGSGTATVNVTLLGGSLDRKAARFVMIMKEDSGHKYWFVTRFELK